MERNHEIILQYDTLHKETAKQQQTIFQSYISAEINIKIYYTNAMTWEDCIKEVETLFNQEYPLQRKRLEFLSYKAMADNQLSHTIAKMMELALFANVKQMAHKDLIALKMLQIIPDDLQEIILMKDQMPSPQAINTMVNSWEAAQVISTSLTTHTK